MAIFLALISLNATEIFAQPVKNTILDFLEIKKTKDQVLIQIGFTFPIRYIRHYPQNKGDQLRIQIKPIIINPNESKDLFIRESIPPQSAKWGDLADVVYEGSDIEGRYLALYFKKTMIFEVTQGNDYRSINVHIIPSQSLPGSSQSESGNQPYLSLMTKADMAMTQKEYGRAIQLYTKLAGIPDPEIQKQAQKKLGIAREENGQRAHAKAEYQKYLNRYPDSASAVEIQNRLDRLTQHAPDREKISSTSKWQNRLRGSFSQFYYFNETYTDANGSIVNQSLLKSDLNADLDLNNSEIEIHTNFNGGYDADFTDDDSPTRVRSAYVDLTHSKSSHSIRLGRQTDSSKGILGRFDGMKAGAQLSDIIILNMVGGFPVDFSTNGFESDTYFGGVSFDIGLLAEHWNFTPYFIHQQTKEMIDRQAIGTEIRYFYSNGSFFSLIDYDIFYKELNIALFSGSHTFSNGAILNLSGDYRQSPFLTTGNALIGQVDTSLEELINTIGKDGVKDLAKNRTAIFRLATLSLTQPINKSLQIGADVSWFNLEGTPASGGVEAIDGSGDELYYSLQLLGNNLFKQGDLAIIGVRYGDTATSDIYTFNLTTRYPLTTAWRINPRLIIDFRQNRNDESDQIKIRPSIRTDYQWNKHLHLELDSGLILFSAVIRNSFMQKFSKVSAFFWNSSQEDVLLLFTFL